MSRFLHISGLELGARNSASYIASVRVSSPQFVGRPAAPFRITVLQNARQKPCETNDLQEATAVFRYSNRVI